MANFVFVHGGMRTASDWDQVRDILAAQGHSTHAPTLSDFHSATLSDHIDQVRGLIQDLGVEPTHLVGHSYGGFVITGVAQARPQALARLVYVDTLLPLPGDSIRENLARHGVNAQEQGISQLPSVNEALQFDPQRIAPIPKLYIHCRASRFAKVLARVASRVREKASAETWSYAEMATNHYPMLQDPQGLAGLLTQA